MHIYNLERWQHNHDFMIIYEKGESRTMQVLILTMITMIVEVIAGNIFGSMALLADGWHMGTHVAAFAISIFAYRYARRHSSDPEFSFGTGKVSVLGGFASAIALSVVALVMAFESIGRLISPAEIRFNEAIIVAISGLVINLVSAFLLQDHHDHDHDHSHDAHEHDDDDDHDDHDHEHEHEEDEHDDHGTHKGHHQDHNIRAAYMHVIADAFTSVLAIIALFSGKYLGWNWLDPIMGLVGATVITKWAYGLVKDTSSILLDQCIGSKTREKIKRVIEADSDNRVVDIHIWKVGPAHYATIISLVTHYEKPPEHYKSLLSGFEDITHVTIEVIPAGDEPCIVLNQ